MSIEYKQHKLHESDRNLKEIVTEADNKSFNIDSGFGYGFDIRCQTFRYHKIHFLIILSTQFQNIQK